MGLYKFFIVIAIIGCSVNTYGQVPANYNADNESQGRQPLGQFLFQQYRNERKNFEKKPNIVGSPYLSDEFVKTAIYSEGGLEGYTYSRYDGYNEELQLKESLSDSTVSVLLKRADIYALVGNTPIFFKEFYPKKGELKKGHLFKLWETGDDDLIVYERRLKRYKEGKAATNSLQLSVKNRFVLDKELYYQKNGKKIQLLKQTKKGILGLFNEDSEKYNAVKGFISDNKINPKESESVLRVLNYYKTL